MPLISLAMIVKNEEATLAHCLESVKSLVDEMIIVDTGSSDRTIDIARGSGARVYQFKWCDDFAAARNESLKYCKGDWALILDGDEAIDPLDYEKIKNACSNPYADAYSLTHRHYFNSPTLVVPNSRIVQNKSNYDEGKNIPFYADASTSRLARMNKRLSFISRIHETFDQSVLRNGGTIAELDAVIHHYGKLFSDREKYKTEYYFLLARREAEKTKDKKAQYNLLQQALAAKQWKIAVRASQASLKSAGDDNPYVLYGGGRALQELEKHEEAIKYFDKLLQKDPEHVLAMLHKGISYNILGDVNAARVLITNAIKLDPICVQAYLYLANMELDLNNFGTARKAVMDAVKIAPGKPSLYNLLLKIEMSRNNNLQAGRDAMLGLQNCPNGGDGLWHRLAAVYLLQTGKHEAAKSILELGIEAFPDNPDLVRLRKVLFSQEK